MAAKAKFCLKTQDMDEWLLRMAAEFTMNRLLPNSNR
jgi:hypothetical protein